MTRNLTKLLILFVALTLATAYAAAQAANDKAPASVQTVTGCLQKGVEPHGGFYLLANNGKHWELYDNGKVSLADYVDQKVTVTGTYPHRSEAQEQVSQPYEKQETGTRKHGDFEVATLKVVSKTCGN